MKLLHSKSKGCLRGQRSLQRGAIVALGMVFNLALPTIAQTPNFEQINLLNQASFSYDQPTAGPPVKIQGITNQVRQTILPAELVDPPGRITGCTGEILPDYTGFSVGLYDPLPGDPTGTAVGSIVALIATEVPDIPGNNIPLGLAPNIRNQNPYPLVNGEQGAYNFLLNPQQGQLAEGRVYILVVNPPAGAIYDQRRIRITIGARTGDLIAYTATSIDGKPLSINDTRTSITGTINLRERVQAGLVLAALNVGAAICQSQDIQIVKTGDRAAAEPGDTVVYRLAIRNLSSTALNNITAIDSLPLGFEFLPNSVQAEFNGTSIPVTARREGSTATFQAPAEFTLPATRGVRETQTGVLNIAYAVRLTPDSVRGSGQNSAVASGQRVDNRLTVRDGPVNHRLRIQPGILSDCGTLIGRVFVDKNFDGEQQPNEPGIPNAVIYMDDGNRIVTDANGLFSVANVISGYRTAALDLTSLPGYALAPNQYFSERNSQSRLVRLEPGGLARVNFGVTPAAQEGQPR